MRLVAWAAVAASVALALFVAVNPYLWRGPVAGIQGMYKERRDEMAFQQEQWPEFAVLNWSERPWLTISGSLQVGPLAETPLAALVNLPLLVIGLVGLLRLLRAAGPCRQAGMLAGWTIGFTLVVMLGLGLKYPRYFMPTTLLFLPLVGFGLVLIAQSAWRRLPRALGRPQPAA